MNSAILALTPFEWINPVGNPDKLKAITQWLGLLVVILQLVYWGVRLSKELDQKKRRSSLLVILNGLITKHPWINTAIHIASSVVVLAFVIVIGIQSSLVATQVAVLSKATLPGARNENILSLEQRISNLEKKAETGGIVQPPPQGVPQYKLVWFNHFEGNMLYQVNRTETGKNDVMNDEFRTWCSPFNEQDYVIQERYLVAADEQFKDVPGKGKENWWNKPEYDNLPKLNPRWLQIMDDERWYVYKVVPRVPAAAH
jgi:hypothetical protein